MSVTSNQVVSDILETEKEYISLLQSVKTLIIDPMLARRNVYVIVEHPQVSIVFSSLLQILSLHEFLRDDLERVLSSDHKITVGKVFLKYAGLFKTYTNVCKFYHYARSLLIHVKHDQTREFIRKAMSNKVMNGATLNDMFELPISRPRQYALYLKTLLETVEEGSSDHDRLLKAEFQLKESVEEIEIAILNHGKVEELLRVELEFMFFPTPPALFSPGRTFIRQGNLNKYCRKTVKRYRFHLFSDLLTYSSEFSSGQLSLHRKIDLHKCIIADIPSDRFPFGFQIISNQKSFVVCAENTIEKFDWIIAINDAITALGNNPSKDGDLAPVWVQNEKQANCSLCETVFSLWMRKHHCRYCGSIVCSSCSQNRRILANISEKHMQRICDSCVPRIDSILETGQSVISKHSHLSILEQDLPSGDPQTMRHLVLLEIVETEQNFVKHLEILYEVFMRPLSEAMFAAASLNLSNVQVEFKHANSGTQQVTIPMKLMKGPLVVFISEIHTLYTLNQEFLEDLEGVLDEGEDSQTIGQVFIEYSSLFKLYGEYAKGHSYAMGIFYLPAFRNYFNLCGEDPRSENRNVFDYTIMPIQRIPRYELLLKALLSQSTADDVDRPNIEFALTRIVEASVAINDAILEHSELRTVRDIEKQFIGDVTLATPGRIFIMKGKLSKRNRKGKLNEYMFMLFNDALLYCEDLSWGYKHHAILDLNHINVKQEDRLDNAFMIVSATKSFVVIADCLKTKLDWIYAIEQELGRNGRKGTLWEAPVWKPDIHANECSKCHSPFSWKLRRHHCRNCGGLFCKDCSDRRILLHHIDPANPVRACRKCFQAISQEKNGPVSPGIETSTSSTPTPWQKDELYPACTICFNFFNVVTRRHHCRVCGSVVCKNCAPAPAYGESFLANIVRAASKINRDIMLGRFACRGLCTGRHPQHHVQEQLIRRIIRQHRWGAVGTVLGVVGLVGGGLFWQRDALKDKMSEETADVASRSLTQKDLVLRAGVVSKEVVGDILKDADTRTMAQAVVVELTMGVLRDPGVGKRVEELLGKAAIAVLAKPEVRQEVGKALIWVIKQEATQEVVNAAMARAVQSQVVREAAGKLSEGVMEREGVRRRGGRLGVDAAEAAVKSEFVREQVKDLVRDVARDPELQAMGSEVLWTVVKGAIWGAKPKQSSPDSVAQAPNVAPEEIVDKIEEIRSHVDESTEAPEKPSEEPNHEVELLVEDPDKPSVDELESTEVTPTNDEDVLEVLDEETSQKEDFKSDTRKEGEGFSPPLAFISS